MEPDWQSVTRLPNLPPDELQIWRLMLPETGTASDIDPEACLHHLTQGERERAARLRVGRVRLEFVVARTCLRILLGNLLALMPNEVPISTGLHGKPETPGIHFNLAHSHGTVLIALSRNSPVGIDVEAVNRQVEALDLAKRNFSREEFSSLEAIFNPEDCQRTFFRLWTRKEAIIKAEGRGLFLPLESFTVPGANEITNVPVQVANSTFLLSSLPVADTHAAAVAVQTPLTVRLFMLPVTFALY